MPPPAGPGQDDFDLIDDLPSSPAGASIGMDATTRDPGPAKTGFSEAHRASGYL